MSYNLIDTSSNNYSTYSGKPFVEFDAGQTFKDILKDHFPTLTFQFNIISERTGRGSRKDCLFEVSFQNSPSSVFYVYCFQTEGGGRSGLPNEARVQWNVHNSWNPDLKNSPKAAEFSKEISNPTSDLTNKECYIFSFYKRDSADKDILISAIYPTQAQDVEINSISNKSIQFQYTDIREAFVKGISASEKGNKELIIHFLPTHLIWYMINRDNLHTSSLQQFQTVVNNQLNPQMKIKQSSLSGKAIPQNVPRNKIVYGAPGTGKSFELRDQAKVIGFIEENIVRVTFHSSYSYQQFVGTYKPTPIYKSRIDAAKLYANDKITVLEGDSDKEPIIDYSFIAGPFLHQLINSIKNPSDNYLIIIEEINRAVVSSVFGDTFQLLDRKEDGESEYEIEFNYDISAYLKTQDISEKRVKLPSNLFIWGTMNSADQGVMPMDAAFKRRWTFEYLPLNKKESYASTYEINFQGKKLKWNFFRKKLNEKLILLGVPEDKLIGPFFLNSLELNDTSSIKNKLLLYLRDDVVRHNPENLFVKKTFSEIVSDYDNGIEIFNALSLTSDHTDDKKDND
jgi:hypothetical protein